MNRDLKALLVKKNIKHKDIAKEAGGVSRQTVAVVIGGYGQSKAIKNATAKLLNIPIEKLEKLCIRKAA